MSPAEALLEELLTEQALSWAHGAGRPAEEYLAKHPELRASPDLVLDLIYGEFLARERTSAPGQPAEFLERFPEFAAQLQRQFEVHAALSTVWPSGDESDASSLGDGASIPYLQSQLQTHGRFELQRRLGAGAMGVVYAVFDRHLQTEVALKHLRRVTPAHLLRFKQEFRTLAQLVHPHLVALHELFAVSGQWFFTMERLHGVEPLRYLAAQPAHRAHLPEVFSQLANGIQALHQAGKLHRDIKPGNVLVTEADITAEQPALRVVLLDCGLAHELRPQFGISVQSERNMVGTPAYMSPEQAVGSPLTEASDWYSYGVMLHQALAGKLPHRDGVGAGHIDAPAAAADPARTALWELCQGLLQRDSARRPQFAQVMRALQTLLPAAVAPRIRLPTAVGPRVFVGRAEQRQQLLNAWQRTAAGESVVVEVSAPSGMGKTCLIEQTLTDLPTDAAAVIWKSTCFERESVAFKAIDGLLDAATQFLLQQPAEVRQACLPPDLTRLARMFPVLRSLLAEAGQAVDAVDEVDEQTARQAASSVLREFISQISKRFRLAIFIDDLQWADADSLWLLQTLLTGSEPPRLLCVLAFRSEELARQPLLSEFCAADSWQTAVVERVRLRLPPLTTGESQTLAETVTQANGAQLTAEAIRALVEEGAGHPYFVQELALFQAETERQRPERAPATLDRLLRLRVQTLPAAAQRALEVLSVAAAPLRRGDVCSAAELPAAQLAVLESLTAERLVRSQGPGLHDILLPWHDRVREAVVAELPAERLQHCHRQLARTLEQHPQRDPAVLAHHYWQAKLPDAAFPNYVLAARQASEALAFERAAALYQQAVVTCPPHDPQLGQLLIDTAAALGKVGRGAEGAQLYLQAVPHVSAAVGIDCQRRAGLQLLRAGQIEASLQTLEPVIQQMNCRLPRSAVAATISFFWHRMRLAWSGWKTDLKPVGSVPRSEVDRFVLYWDIGICLQYFNRFRGLDAQARAMVLAVRLGDPSCYLMALAYEALVATYGGPRSWPRATAAHRVTRVLLHRTREPFDRICILCSLMLTRLLTGSWRRAQLHAEEALRSVAKCRHSGQLEVSTSYMVQAIALFHLGRMAELVERVEPLVQDAVVRADLHGRSCVAGSFGNALWLAADRPEQARRELDYIDAHWNNPYLGVHQFLGLVAATHLDLYQGKADEAYRRLTDIWWRLRWTGGLQLYFFRTCFFVARATAALAVCVQQGPNTSLIRDIQWFERTLRREPVAWAQAIAAMLAAQLADVQGMAHSAAELYRVAIEKCRVVEMQLHAAACELRLAQITTGDESPAAVAARACFTAERIRKPTLYAGILVPLCRATPAQFHPGAHLANGNHTSNATAD